MYKTCSCRLASFSCDQRRKSSLTGLFCAPVCYCRMGASAAPVDLCLTGYITIEFIKITRPHAGAGTDTCCDAKHLPDTGTLTCTTRCCCSEAISRRCTTRHPWTTCGDHVPRIAIYAYTQYAAVMHAADKRRQLVLGAEAETHPRLSTQACH